MPDSRILVWPETAVPAFDSEVGTSVLQPLHEQLRQQGRDLLLQGLEPLAQCRELRLRRVGVVRATRRAERQGEQQEQPEAISLPESKCRGGGCRMCHRCSSFCGSTINAASRRARAAASAAASSRRSGAAAGAAAQAPAPSEPARIAPADSAANIAADAPRSGWLYVLPVVAYSPETKLVFGASTGRYYRFSDDPDSRPTTVSPLALVTTIALGCLLLLLLWGAISATVTAFALKRSGHPDVRVYDGSLQEWAADPTLPMST